MPRILAREESQVSPFLRLVQKNVDFECVLEINGPYKIGEFMPGTRIPALKSKLFDDPPDYLLMFSWNIANELMPRFRQKGYQGRFIIPLPSPRDCLTERHQPKTTRAS